MKNLLITVAFCTATFSINAQILSEQELADVNSETIATFDQMKRNSEIAFTKGIQTFAIVGTGLPCLSYTNNFATIQGAIDADFEEIRITTDTYSENILIDDKNVQLLGGYASCSDASNGIYDSDSVSTTIRPANGSGQPAIQIQSNTRRYVTLRNLTAKNGEFTDPLKGGGLSIYYADLGLTLNTVVLAQNKSNYGGGMSIYSGNTDVKAHNLMIINNSANYGGGIYCAGENSILIDADEDAGAYGIVSNQATNGGGGGAYIASKCKLTSYVGADDGFFDLRGFLNNQAGGSGGAIYAIAGAKINLYGNRFCGLFSPHTCYGHNSTPVNLSGNTAAFHGGAIYASGSDTAVYGNNLKVNLNTAQNGSAAYLRDGASFQTQTTYDNGSDGQAKHCWSKGKCNQFIGNKTTPDDTQPGSTFHVNKSQLKMTRSHIEDNQAYWGNVFYLYGSATNFELESSYVTGNEFVRTEYIRAPIRIHSDASARIAYSTIADNYTNSNVPSIYNTGGNLQLYSSIIHNDSSAKALAENNSISNETDCLIVNKLGAISDSRSIVADPQFVDRNNNDYHLNAALSPAVDYCDDVLAQHTTADTDRDNRGWNDYTVGNLHGPFDVGADESYGNDVIFEDGFEGGDIIFKDGFE